MRNKPRVGSDLKPFIRRQKLRIWFRLIWTKNKKLFYWWSFQRNWWVFRISFGCLVIHKKNASLNKNYGTKLLKQEVTSQIKFWKNALQSNFAIHLWVLYKFHEERMWNNSDFWPHILKMDDFGSVIRILRVLLIKGKSYHGFWNCVLLLK